MVLCLIPAAFPPGPACEVGGDHLSPGDPALRHMFPEERDTKKLLVDKIPFLAVGAVFGVLAVESHSASTWARTAWHGEPVRHFLTHDDVLIRYIGLVSGLRT